MASIPKNHSELYFDNLVRTQKMESVLSLIHATYHAKKNISDQSDIKNLKNEIAKRLESSYNLFRDNPKGAISGSGTYTGDISQFDSQYTIGHELCIWKNSNLDLTPMAQQVAENIITIRDYFDVVFFNYFQPVNGVAIHPVYSILKYMSENGLIKIPKSSIPDILGVTADNGAINALCNFLDGTHYFKLVDKSLLFTGKTTTADYLKYCNTKYVGEQGYLLAKSELGNEENYIEYLTFSVYEDQQDLELVGRKELFRQWLSRQTKSNGEKYSDIVVKNYPYFIIRISKIINVDLYSISDLRIFEEIKKQIESDQNYIEANEKQNNNFSAGLKKYEEFLGFNHPEEQTPFIEIKEENEEVMVQRFPRENSLFPLNFILYGAPGTGKTYSTVEYALSIIKNKIPNLGIVSNHDRAKSIVEYNDYSNRGQICFVTFHQNYTYEDFVQGLKPDVESQDLKFIKSEGIFMSISKRAEIDPSNNYVIVLDEINRGNISRIFGELITLIEEDKRMGELNGLTLTLSSGDVFSVPNNLYIIGTMNTADKSISLLDIALRRRFSFIEVAPNEELITDLELKRILIDLNDFLRNELKGTDMLIGHSYFINKSEKDISSVFNNNIIPLLYEYFYDDEIKVKRALNKTLGTKWLIKDTRGRIKIENK